MFAPVEKLGPSPDLRCAAMDLAPDLGTIADYRLTSEGLRETSVEPWLLGRCWGEICPVAIFGGRNEVDRSPAKALHAGVDRQRHHDAIR